MIVAELQQWLSQQNPQSPICIMGIADCGASVQKWDINLGTGQGPSDEIDEILISWDHTREAEARYETQKH